MDRYKFNELSLKSVADDLEYIMKQWGPVADDATLRRDSVVLRRLLNEGQLGRAWRSVGFAKEPKILAMMLDSAAAKESPTFAQAGGALYGGVIVRNMEYRQTDNIKKYLQEKKHPTKPHKEPLRLSAFLDSICVIVEGNKVSRRDLISYIANTLGGAHIDTQREFTGQQREKFKSLDSWLNRFELAGKNAIYYELLSIGQSLRDSKDIQKLVKRIREVLNSPRGMIADAN